MSEENENFKAEDITFTSGRENEQTTENEEPTTETTTQVETETRMEEESSTETQEEESEQESETETEEETPSTEEEEQKPDFNQLLSEQSKGQFKTYGDLQKHLDLLAQNQRSEQDELDNDLLKKFKDFRTGRTGDPKTIAKLFLDTQTLEVDELSAMDAIRTKMKFENPKRSEEDIDFLLNRKYKLDENEFEEDEIRLAKLQLEDDATAARADLKKVQEKAALNESQSSQTVKEQQEQIKEANDKWQSDVESTMSGFETLSLPLNDKGDTFNFNVENSEVVKATISNLPGFWNRYISQDEKGNTMENIEQLRDDMTFLENRNQILQSVYEHGVSMGKDEMLKERKNVDSKDGKTQTDTGGQKSEMEELAEGLGAQLNKKS